jgi:hypothetical protein
MGQAVNLQLKAFDPAGLPMTYSAVGLPSGLSIDPSTGLISGRLTGAGTYKVTVAVRDSLAATSTTWFNWTVDWP